MDKRMKKLLALLALIVSPVYAADMPFFNSSGAINQNTWYISNSYSDGNSWDYCWWKQAQIVKNGNGLQFLISSKADFKGITNDIPVGKYACGELQSWSVQKYGTYQVTMKVDPNSGTNTAFFFYDGWSNTKSYDEIDIEMLGLHPTRASINYWVGGVNQSLTPINTGFNTTQAFHTYSFTYLPTSISWSIDGKQVFQTKPGAKMPTHSGRIYLEFWTGMPGWLGALNYTAPISAEYGNVNFTPYTPLTHAN